MPPFVRSLPRLLSKRITIPRLSPTHSQAKIRQWMVRDGTAVEAYDIVVILECAHVSEYDGPESTLLMAIDTQEEGIVRDLSSLSNSADWMPVGTAIGWIDDGDDIDGDWIWQAYLEEEEKEEVDLPSK
jgi:pyruvate/2-oxoglutarate dehydrogenase complex dihydrolipoamide acyltransferase (E2) component